MIIPPRQYGGVCTTLTFIGAEILLRFILHRCLGNLFNAFGSKTFTPPNFTATTANAFNQSECIRPERRQTTPQWKHSSFVLILFYILYDIRNVFHENRKKIFTLLGKRCQLKLLTIFIINDAEHLGLVMILSYSDSERK